MGTQKPVYTSKRRGGAAAARSRAKKATATTPETATVSATAVPLILSLRPDPAKVTANENVEGARTRPSRSGRTKKLEEAIAEITRVDSDGDSNGEAVETGAQKLRKKNEQKLRDLHAEIKGLEKRVQELKKGGVSQQRGGDAPHQESDKIVLADLEIPGDVLNFYDDLATEKTIHMQLPMIIRPEQHADGTIIESTQPWTSESLFKLYLYSYSKNNYHLCDLIADTWIRAHQNRDANPRLKIWKENRSQFKKDAKDVPDNDNDDGNLWLDKGVGGFNFNLLKQLYDHTNAGCGARNLWADALALCGNWLEKRMEWQGHGMELWHPQLMWDVLHTALRLIRVRLTLKIEEGDPKEWCNRYHEHTKHNEMCYRELAKEQLAGGSHAPENDVEMTG